MTVIDSRGGIWSHTAPDLEPGDIAETKLHIEVGPATIIVSTSTDARVRIRDETVGSVITLYVTKSQVGTIVGSGTYTVQALNRGTQAADVHFMCGYGEGAKGQPEPLALTEVLASS